MRPRKILLVPWSSQVNDKDRPRIQDSWVPPSLTPNCSNSTNSSNTAVYIRVFCTQKCMQNLFMKIHRHSDKEKSSLSLFQGSDLDLIPNSTTRWLCNPGQITVFPRIPISQPSNSQVAGSTDEKSMKVLCKTQILTHVPRAMCPRESMPLGLCFRQGMAKWWVSPEVPVMEEMQ